MNTFRVRATLRWATVSAGFAAGVYAGYVGVAWYRYGKVPRVAPDEADHLLDRFMPEYEVVERHRIGVAAPASITLAAAAEQDLLRLPLVRAIFRAREIVLGSASDGPRQPKGLLSHVRSLGWGVLAEVSGREVVVGAYTQPWEPNVIFRALPADEFAAFREPGYVKIAWTLRADPVGEYRSIFRTETRAIATDSISRARFRWYWARFSPGIAMIRRMSLRPLRLEAERRAIRARVIADGVRPSPVSSPAER